jgi:hypothetical protein
MISAGDEKQTDTRATLPSRTKNHGPLGNGDPQGAGLFSGPVVREIHLVGSRKE